LEGRGVPIDFVAAANYLRLSADHCWPDGQFWYGCCLCGGRGVPIDFAGAARYFRLSAAQKCPAAAYRYGLLVESIFPEATHTEVVIGYYLVAAHFNNHAAMTKLGIASEFARGGLRNWANPRQYYQQSANAGDPEAESHLGFCLQHGIGGLADPAQSIQWYQRSHDHGNIEGARGLASAYHFGIGCDVNLEEAADCYGFTVQPSGRREANHSDRCLRALGKAKFTRKKSVADSNSKPVRTCPAHPHPHATSPLMSDYLEQCTTTHFARLIGYGGFSTVFAETDVKTRETTALKRFNPGAFDQTKFIREVKVLVSMNHPCVLHILGWKPPIEKEPAEIRSPIAENGSVHTILEKVAWGARFHFWNPTGKGILILGIALGMRYIHSKGIIHGDLKPSNILVTGCGEALISDFGLSRPECPDYTLTPDSATVNYSAPELFEEDALPTRKVDIYAFGLLVYEILTETAVFPTSEGAMPNMKRILSGKLPPIPDECGPVMQALIPRCWSRDPKQRPTFDEMIHDFRSAKFRIVPRADEMRLGVYAESIENWEADDAVQSQSK
jgi:hypothetical protein